MVDYWPIVAFVVLGFGVGVYGTLVGAGGGFLLVPLLLLVFGYDSEQAAGTSLAVVFLNALSGTWAYVRQRRIDYRTGLIFAAATVPGSILGAYLSRFFSQDAFMVVFGVCLLAIAALLWLRPAPGHIAKAPPVRGWGQVSRRLVDASGVEYAWHFNLWGGIALSVAVGFLSSILGIGGGIIHVPALVFLFDFPAHIATATSHFILAISAGVGSASHLALGHIRFEAALPLGAGVIVGAQVGARLAKRVHGSGLLRLLSLALVVVGLRLIVGVLL